MRSRNIKDTIKKRYSIVAEQKQQSCCGGNSCCGGADPIALARDAGYRQSDLELIPKDASLGLGCGSPVTAADLKEGETVLDLGSGAGMDVFLSANTVGVSGKVIGVDMTDAMVKKATSIARREGYTNVEFCLGEIEKLPFDDNYVDVVISNCVINLSTDKAKVFREAFRVLKPGGRLVVSDIVSDGELPREIRNNLDLWAGCVAGALEQQEYLDLIKTAGFVNLQIKSNSEYRLTDSLKKDVGGIRSITVKAYK